MNILITGANGYIGKSLHNALKHKYNVTAVTRKDYDLTEQLYLKKLFRSDYDIVLHCAGTVTNRLRQDLWSDMDSNLKMYYNLLSYKHSYDKFIHFGSGVEYYTTETPYALSKKVIANSISEIDNFYNIRIFGLFDENEMDTRFIKSNIQRYIDKQPMLLHQNKYMDFFYMQDLITLVKHYIDSDSSELFKDVNCSYTDTFTLMDIANMINELDSYTVPILLDNPYGVDYSNDNCIPYELNYVGLKQGIVETYNKLKNEK